MGRLYGFCEFDFGEFKFLKAFHSELSYRSACLGSKLSDLRVQIGDHGDKCDALQQGSEEGLHHDVDVVVAFGPATAGRSVVCRLYLFHHSTGNSPMMSCFSVCSLLA